MKCYSFLTKKAQLYLLIIETEIIIIEIAEDKEIFIERYKELPNVNKSYKDILLFQDEDYSSGVYKIHCLFVQDYLSGKWLEVDYHFLLTHPDRRIRELIKEHVT